MFLGVSWNYNTFRTSIPQPQKVWLFFPPSYSYSCKKPSVLNDWKRLTVKLLGILSRSFLRGTWLPFIQGVLGLKTENQSTGQGSLLPWSSVVFLSFGQDFRPLIQIKQKKNATGFLFISCMGTPWMISHYQRSIQVMPLYIYIYHFLWVAFYRSGHYGHCFANAVHYNDHNHPAFGTQCCHPASATLGPS